MKTQICARYCFKFITYNTKNILALITRGLVVASSYNRVKYLSYHELTTYGYLPAQQRDRRGAPYHKYK